MRVNILEYTFFMEHPVHELLHGNVDFGMQSKCHENYVQFETFLILVFTTNHARFRYDLQHLSMLSYAARATLDFLYGVMMLT